MYVRKLWVSTREHGYLIEFLDVLRGGGGGLSGMGKGKPSLLSERVLLLCVEGLVDYLHAVAENEVVFFYCYCHVTAGVVVCAVEVDVIFYCIRTGVLAEDSAVLTSYALFTPCVYLIIRDICKTHVVYMDCCPFFTEFVGLEGAGLHLFEEVLVDDDGVLSTPVVCRSFLNLISAGLQGGFAAYIVVGIIAGYIVGDVLALFHIALVFLGAVQDGSELTKETCCHGDGVAVFEVEVDGHTVAGITTSLPLYITLAVLDIGNSVIIGSVISDTYHIETVGNVLAYC